MQYNFVDESSKPKTVTVITPTIGQEYLLKAIDSVNKQTYAYTKHLVVIDGPQFVDKVNLLNISEYYINLQTTVSPENTGKTGGDFYGHRVYAGYPHLINSDYVAFLDEDNWYEPNHIESLVKTLESKNYDWIYSLRNIHQKTGEFIEKDCCESLGRWPIFWSLDKEQKEYLVDTSSYLFKREFLIQVCQHWHSGWGGDRRFYHIISKLMKHDNYGTSGQHTMCYRLDDNIEKKYGNINFFKDGNATVLKHYGEYPWQKTLS